MIFDLKLKLIILAVAVSAVLFYAWHWHTTKVNQAVTAAVTQLELQYNREIFKLKDKANEKSIELQAKIDQQRKQSNAKLKDLDTRYNNFRKWVLNQSSNQTSNSRVPNDTSNAESTGGTYFGGLYTRDAEFLAKYARSTETLKIELLACYQQYDEVKNTLDKFKQDNTPKTD